MVTSPSRYPNAGPIVRRTKRRKIVVAVVVRDIKSSPRYACEALAELLCGRRAARKLIKGDWVDAGARSERIDDDRDGNRRRAARPNRVVVEVESAVKKTGLSRVPSIDIEREVLGRT